MSMIHDNWTPEDFQRANSLNLRRKLVAFSMVRKGDRVDYEAMLARERYESTRKAGARRSYLPMSAVLTEAAHGDNLRSLYARGVIA